MRIIIALLMLSMTAYAETSKLSLQFPIDDQFCETLNGKIVLTSWYYLRRQDTNGNYYRALNTPLKLNTPVKSCYEAVVIETGYNKISGIYVKTSINEDLIISYEHLNNWAVKTGDILKKGDIVGFAGRTGRATGVNLRIVAYDGKGRRIYITDQFNKKFYCKGDGTIKGVTNE